jgi:hypothetical protein
MPPAGFEPAIPTCERPQTHALDCAATGVGLLNQWSFYFAELHDQENKINPLRTKRNLLYIKTVRTAQ